jgi:hypothetical protein
MAPFVVDLLCGAAAGSGDGSPWSACVLYETIPDHSTQQKPANTGDHSKCMMCVEKVKASLNRPLYSGELPCSERRQ